MKLMLIVCLAAVVGWADAQTDTPEWQMVVPETSATVAGVYGDHNQPLLIDQDGVVSAVVLADYLPFSVPDQAAIQAISFRETDDIEPILLVVFSVAVDVYMPGEVLQCQNQQCQSVFNPAVDLGLNQPVYVDAVSSVNAFGTHLSFDVGFEFNGQYIDPANLYGIGGFGQSIVLTLQTTGASLGFSEVSNLIATDQNADLLGFSLYFGADTAFIDNNEIVQSDQLLLIANDTQVTRVAYDLPDDLGNFLAFSSLNTGYLGFFLTTSSVDEAAGNIDVLVYRFAGGESAQQVVVEAANQSAINGVDFQFNPTTLTWLDGDVEPKPVAISMIDNQIVDGDKTFTLNLFVGSELTAVEPAQSTLTVTILDDEGGDLIFKDGFD